MVIKEVKPVNFLFYRTETKVNELSNFLPVSQDIFREAVNNNLTITGPLHWHYFGFNGDERKPFTLEIAVPVAEVLDSYDGKYHFKRTDTFKCVSAVHEGSWFELPKTYGTLMQFIGENKLQSLGVNRELYVNVDFKNHDANVTEVQIGVK